MPLSLNADQLTLLKQIADGIPDGQMPNPKRTSARALERRDLVRIVGRGPRWRATITEAGRYFVEHGEYPVGHRYRPAERRAVTNPVPETATVTAPTAPVHVVVVREDDWEVDSPRGKRRRGRNPRGDDLLGGPDDSYDEKIFVSVKEAAWMLSLPESAIYAAVRNRDLDRVYIGAGETNYRIVYGSLLAWINDLPREPASRSWWL